mmetsp:Transcript_11334/g.32166  ORF Transcript_11334/g.32166 Transcript_11334/m.32166 type:complete len:1002 (+) Transcript_11334:314-3319(+)
MRLRPLQGLCDRAPGPDTPSKRGSADEAQCRPKGCGRGQHGSRHLHDYRAYLCLHHVRRRPPLPLSACRQHLRPELVHRLHAPSHPGRLPQQHGVGVSHQTGSRSRQQPDWHHSHDNARELLSEHPVFLSARVSIQVAMPPLPHPQPSSAVPVSYLGRPRYSRGLAACRCVFNETAANARNPWWTEADDTCADLAPTTLDTLPATNDTLGSSDIYEGACFSHLPFCNSETAHCSCCELELDVQRLGIYPPVALLLMALSQVAFLLFLLLLRHQHVATTKAVDESVISLPDYSLWVRGLPEDATDNKEIADFFRHYGEVVSANTIIGMGGFIQPSHRIQRMKVTLQELKAKAAIDAGQATGPKGRGGCFGRVGCHLYWFMLTGFKSAKKAAAAMEEKIRAELDSIHKAERSTIEHVENLRGEAVVTMNYERHKKNAMVDLRRSVWDNFGFNVFLATLQGKRNHPPHCHGKHITIHQAPEPSDYAWENSSVKNEVARKVMGWTIFVTAVVVSCVVQYFLAAAAEQERTERILRQLQSNLAQSTAAMGTMEQQNRSSNPFEDLLTFMASGELMETVSYSIIGWSYGLVVVLLDLLISFVQTWTSTNIERWSTNSRKESSDVLKVSLFYIINSFVIPFVAAYWQWDGNGNLSVERDGRALWFLSGGVIESLLWIQVFNSFLGDVLQILNPVRLLNYRVLSHHALTQEQLDLLMAAPPAAITLRYAGAVKTVALAMLTAPVLPLAPIIACFGLILSYFTDKMIFLRLCHVKAKLSHHLADHINRLMVLLPLGQLLLMQFVFFPGQPYMTDLFIAGLIFWMVYAFVPVRKIFRIESSLLSQDGGTNGLSYMDTLHTKLQEAYDDPYMEYHPELLPIYCPPIRRKICSEEIWQLIHSHFSNEAEAPLSPILELLPDQLPSTGGPEATSRPPILHDVEEAEGRGPKSPAGPLPRPTAAPELPNGDTNLDISMSPATAFTNPYAPQEQQSSAFVNPYGPTALQGGNLPRI